MGGLGMSSPISLAPSDAGIEANTQPKKRAIHKRLATGTPSLMETVHLRNGSELQIVML